MALPDVVTHRYDPTRGAGLNVCSLSDVEAEAVLDRLRRDSRPSLKNGYLLSRRLTEKWLSVAAATALGRLCVEPPVYFFLGDFSHLSDGSRPAALIVPLASLPADGMTFTLGDSMSVSESTAPKLFTLEEMVRIFLAAEAVAGFGLSDAGGFQSRFIEMQLWDKHALVHNLPTTPEPALQHANAK